MDTDRPMSEYESALFEAILAIAQTLTVAGAINESMLISKLSESRSAAELMGSKNGAATLGHLIKFLAEPPVFYVPGPGPAS